MTPAQRKFLEAVRGDPGGQRAGHSGVTIKSCWDRGWVRPEPAEINVWLLYRLYHFTLTQRGAAALREVEA